MRKKKVDPRNVALWVYLLLIVLWALYGFRDSVAAGTFIRVLADAFALILGQ